MKRFVSLVLVFMLVLCSLVVPASASDFDNDSLINVLDYATANDSGSNYVLLGNATKSVSFSLPVRMKISYIDILLYSNVTPSISVNGTSLTVLQVNSWTYRLYGDISSTGFTEVLTLSCVGSSSAAYVDFDSIRIMSDQAEHFADVGTISVDLSPLGSESKTMSSTTATATVGTGLLDGGSATTYFQCLISSSNWRKYDYIDFFFTLYVSEVNSFRVSYNNVAVPFEFVSLQNGLNPGGSGSGMYMACVRIDVRSLDRTASGSPVISVSGMAQQGYNQFFRLTGVSGYVIHDDINPLFHYLQMLFDKLESLLNPNGASSGDFGSTVESQGSEIGDIADAMDDVTKPPLDDVSGSVDGYVSSDDIDSIGSVFSSLFENGIVSNIIMLSLTLALVSYVLYGKR